MKKGSSLSNGRACLVRFFGARRPLVLTDGSSGCLYKASRFPILADGRSRCERGVDEAGLALARMNPISQNRVFLVIVVRFINLFNWTCRE